MKNTAIEQLEDIVDPGSVEGICDNLLNTADSNCDDLNKLSQAIIYHRFIRFQILNKAQAELKTPKTTATKEEGGRLDQIVLLTSMLFSKGIACRVVQAANPEQSLYTLEILVENESETQAVGIDAKQEYRFRESSQREGLYWTPADPQLCSRPAKLGDLEDEGLLRKKSKDQRRFFEWRTSKGAVTIWP